MNSSAYDTNSLNFDINSGDSVDFDIGWRQKRHIDF